MICMVIACMVSTEDKLVIVAVKLWLKTDLVDLHKIGSEFCFRYVKKS